MKKILLYFLLAFLALWGSCDSPAPTQNEETSTLGASPSAFRGSLISGMLDPAKRSPLYLSTDQGLSWQDAGQGLPLEIEVSFLDTLDQRLLVATDNKGLFISDDSLIHWREANLGLPSLKLTALEVASGDLYVGVYRSGIYTSADTGKHWSPLNLDLPDLRVQSILVDRGQLLVGTDQGIYALDEEEKKWKPLFEGVQVLSLEVLGEKWVAGTNQGTLLSPDQGVSWAPIHALGAVHYTHVVAGQIVEMYINQGNVFFSGDLGKTWREAQYGPRQGSYVYEVVEVGEKLVMSNNYGIHQSSDGGNTWSHVFQIESMGFFDFIVIDDILYGGTRTWDEFRKR